MIKLNIDLEKVNPEEVFICGCDVTLKDILDLIDQGITDIQLIKRLTHVGMGFCQGRYCIDTVAQVIAWKTEKDLKEIKLPDARMPVRPVKMKVMANEK
ncbi:MAG: (2Fe-2S)-binding protein [Thermococcus sp.]|uniref:(2Fe-2S)-binding protein n=1 Tax=Thermococcus sp. TaxID=35749 RepID=UPI001DDEABDE|nr:(2Fe-2S)-binding protein [Thermococcus sp.]MBO8174495.1 (2Fe-2S)-binding protein [Thermococcus sp.]